MCNQENQEKSPKDSKPKPKPRKWRLRSILLHLLSFILIRGIPVHIDIENNVNIGEYQIQQVVSLTFN
jgi:hypothetical protein